MIRNIIFYGSIILLFLLGALLQFSFFPSFAFLGIAPNLLFALFFVLMFSAVPARPWEGVWAAIIAGFFLDLFSPSYFGLSIIMLLLVCGLIKLIFHFLRSDQLRQSTLGFVIMFGIAFACYTGLGYLASRLLPTHYHLNLTTILEAVYSLLLAMLGFWIYRKIIGLRQSSSQLTLFK